MCKELAEEEEDEALIKEEPKEPEEEVSPAIPEDVGEVVLPTIPEDAEEETESAPSLPTPGVLPRRLVRKNLFLHEIVSSLFY